MECAVSPLLDSYFPPLSGVQVLAQPGAFYVAAAFSLAVNVIGKKILNQQWDSLAQGTSLTPYFSPTSYFAPYFPKITTGNWSVRVFPPVEDLASVANLCGSASWPQPRAPLFASSGGGGYVSTAAPDPMRPPCAPCARRGAERR